MKSMKRLTTTRFERKRNFMSVIALSVLAVIVSLSVLQLYVSNSYATSGGNVKQLEEERKQLELESEQLQNELVELQSLSRVASESQRLGMVRPTKFLYTSLPHQVAVNGSIE